MESRRGRLRRNRRHAHRLRERKADRTGDGRAEGPRMVSDLVQHRRRRRRRAGPWLGAALAIVALALGAYVYLGAPPLIAPPAAPPPTVAGSEPAPAAQPAPPIPLEPPATPQATEPEAPAARPLP